MFSPLGFLQICNVKKLLLALLIFLPITLLGQWETARILIFRKTGWIKSAQCLAIEVVAGQKHKLCNNSALALQPVTEYQKIRIRLGNHTKTDLVKINPNDTLYFEVKINSTAKGILPSDRFRSKLILLTVDQGRARMKEKWVRASLRVDE